MAVNKNNYEIKMAILTLPGYKNTAWLNFEKYNDKRTQQNIIEGMFTRFKRNKLALITRVVQFYNKEGELIEQREF